MEETESFQLASHLKTLQTNPFTRYNKTFIHQCVAFYMCTFTLDITSIEGINLFSILYIIYVSCLKTPQLLLGPNFATYI